MNRLICAAAALALCAAPAAAHIVLETSSTPVGASYKATFRVTHGCDGAATTGLRVKLPEGFIGAKPMPKPGWELKLTKGPYKASYAFYHGKTLSEGVTEITWSGGELSNEFVDEFTLFAFVARELKAGETLAFPVIQDCAGGKSTEWVELAKDEKDHPDRPAPTLKLVEQDEHAGH